MSKIALIGLGNIGGPMSLNLVKAGRDVTANDIVTEKVERAAKAGVVTPLGERGRALYETFCENRDGEIDFAAIVQMMRETGRS